MSAGDIFLGLIAILFPPIAVWIKRGLCSLDSLLNLLLCTLGYIPGLLHAWYIIAKYPDDLDYESLPQDAEGRTVYYVVTQGGAGQAQAPRASHHVVSGPGAPQTMNYGTTTSAPVPPAAVGGEGASSESGVPPSYADAVKGDNKIQT